MKKRLSNSIIVIPLHVPINFPCDYLDQTAKILSRGNLVVLFDFQNPSLWKETLSNIKNVITSMIRIIYGKNGDQIYFKPFSLFPTLNFGFIFKLNRIFAYLQLKFLLSLKRKKVIVWGFDPVIEPVLGRVGESLSIYDCVDYLGEDQQTSFANKPEIKLFAKADIISFNSQGLYREKLKKNKNLLGKSFAVCCGCNYDLFQKKDYSIPHDLKKIKGKKIIFAGHLDYRLNPTLLIKVVTKNPQLNFIFLGKILNDVDKRILPILKKKNVFFLGLKKKAELPQYYKNCDLGIIPYNVNYSFVKYSNPMKAYEYLATGIPVLSTEIEALKKYPNDIVYTTNNEEEFSKAIKKLISNWGEEKIVKARKIARKNSWHNKILDIEKFLINGKKIQ